MPITLPHVTPLPQAGGDGGGPRLEWCRPWPGLHPKPLPPAGRRGLMQITPPPSRPSRRREGMGEGLASSGVARGLAPAPNPSPLPGGGA